MHDPLVLSAQKIWECFYWWVEYSIVVVQFSWRWDWDTLVLDAT